MKRFLFLVGLSVAALPHCSPYGPWLLDDDEGDIDGGSGGSPGSGGVSTGGVSTGGTGGITPTGGDGSGGTNVGGETGGQGQVTEALVDDLEQGPVYSNSPFTGGWDRFIDTGTDGGTWAAATLAAMVQEIPDDEGNHAFHVEATDFGPTSWGLGVYLTLNQATDVDPIDISGFTKLRFRARGSSSTATILRISIEDEASHTAPPCPDVDCVPHASVGQRSLNATEWQTIELALNPTRTPAFDPTQAYAIHFTMDPPTTETVIDFWIDDIWFE